MVASGTAPGTPALHAHGDSFLQLQFKAKCTIHQISATVFDARNSRLIICDNKTFSVWQLQDSRLGQGYMTYSTQTPVPKGVTQVTSLCVDAVMGAYIATGITSEAEHLVMLLAVADGALSVKAGAPLKHKEAIECAIYNPRVHELILSTSVNESHGRLRFFSFRESVVHTDRSGLDRFLLIQNRESSPGKESKGDAKEKDYHTVYGVGKPIDTRVRCLALDLRSNHLFGSLRRGLLVWDAESAETLFELQNLGGGDVEALAVLEGGDFVATCCQEIGEYVVSVWQLDHAGGALACATFPSRHAIQLMAFADHGGPSLPRGQLALYLTDASNHFRCLILTPPGYEPGRPTTVGPSTPTQPLAHALGRRGYVEAIAAFQNTASLGDVVAFDARELKQGYLCASPLLARFQLSLLLVVDDSVLGLSLHAPGSATTLCPLSGGVTALSVLPDARMLTPEGGEGVVLALCHAPHALNLVHRTSGRLLQSISLPSTGRAFQYTPPDTAPSSPYPHSPFRPASSALALPGPLPTCFKPIPLTSWVAVGYADGRVDVMDVPSGRRVQVLQPPAPVGVPLTCLSWWPIGASLPQAAQSAYAMLRRPLILAGGYGDGRVVLWLLHALGSSLLAVLPAHPSPIVMAKPRYGQPPLLRFVLLTAAADGMVKAWAPAHVESAEKERETAGKVPGSGVAEREGGGLGSEWVLVGMIHPKGEGRVLCCAEVLSQGVVALGFEDGFIELWDVPSGEGKEERGVHMFCHPGAAVARMQAEREKGRGKESAGGSGEAGGERLREGVAQEEEAAREEQELAGGEASEEEGGEGGEEEAERDEAARPESAPSAEAQGQVKGAEGAGDGNGGGCAKCCGGPHLAVPRAPLQRFAAHRGAVACLAVRSGSSTVRLLASASADRSVLLCTFDGRRLRVFQRCLLTHPRTLSLLSLDITPPLHPHTPPQWRILAGCGSFVTILRAYERPIEVKMPSFTTLTDRGKEAFTLLTRHTLELAPFVCPVRGTVTSTVLCPFRYRRLKPVWLPLPEEGDEDKPPRKPSKPTRQGAKAPASVGEGTGPPPTAASPERSPTRRRDSATAGSASRPLPLRVVDVDDCCSLPETGQRASYHGSARFRTIHPAKRQATQPSPEERPAWAVTTDTESETGYLPEEGGVMGTQPNALLLGQFSESGRPVSPPRPQVETERPMSVLPSRGGALHPWTPMASQDMLMEVLEDGSGLLTRPPTGQTGGSPSQPVPKPLLRPEDSDESDLSSGSEDESSQSAPLPLSHSSSGGKESETQIRDSTPPESMQPSSAPPSIAPRTIRRPRRRSRAAQSTVASGLYSLESNNSSLSSPVRRFVHSILRFDVAKELLPTFLSQYYQHAGAAGGSSDGNQRGELAGQQQQQLRPSKAILDILAEYRKLGRPARKPFTADTANNWNGCARGVHVGFALGSYDRRLSEAIDRRERELEEEMLHMAKRQDTARSARQQNRGKKARMDLGRVGLKEEEDRMFWLDCLAEGYHAPEVARPRSNPTMLHKVMDAQARAKVKTPAKVGVAVASPRVARDQDDPLMRLFKRLKGEQEQLMSFDQLLKWDKLVGLMASGHVNRSLLRSLLIGEDGDEGPRKNGLMLGFADFQRFVAALDLHMSWLYAPPVVQARLNEVTMTSVSLWLSVDKACSVRLGLYLHASPQTHHNPRALAALLSDVASGRNAVRNAGPIACERSDKSYDVALDNLQEGTAYDLFVYAEHPLGPQGGLVGLDGEGLHRSKITIETEVRQSEPLWIEWDGLNKQQQDVELIAVSKDRAVLSAAASAGVRVPTYDDFLSSSSASVRICREFKGWWAHSSTRALREGFLFRELEYAVAHEPTLREGMGRDGVVLEPGDLDILKLRENQIQSQEGRLKRERSNYFRSWYKGGRVMEDLPSHVVSVGERRAERLAWRTEFLSRRSARVEEAWALAQTLIDALRQEERRASTASSVASTNSSDESESRLGARGERMRGAKAARARELLQAMALSSDTVTTAQLSNAYLLEVFDTLRLTAKPTSPRSQQVSSAASRGSVVMSPRKLAAKAGNNDFMVVKAGGGAQEETAPPPPPPEDQVGYRDMPSELGTLELRVALTLPEVMELAVNDGVEVPQIEDALSLLPSRKACWHAFLDWYVSAEDVYETKWYDNPDRGRRDLSFVSGAREALLRQEGDAARRDGLVRRMLDWNSPRAATAIMNRGFHVEGLHSSSSQDATGPDGPGPGSAGSSQTGEGSSADGLSGSVSNSNSQSSSSTETDERLHMAVDKEFRKQYFNNYHVRKRFLQTQIRSMLVSRRCHALIPLAWTTFPTPVTLFASLPQFMPQQPPQRPRRVILFPTADPELYSLDDIKAWYGEAELAVDDDVMREAEREQQILAFQNLTIERERLEGVMKIWEDRRSEMMLIAEGFLSVLEAEGLPRPSRRFHHQPDLPPVEDGEGMVPELRFPQGTGLENHDEEADAAKEEKHLQEQEEKKRALIRKQREEEIKRRRDEEIRKKEDERRQERIKQQEDERRSIVAHLTELKAQKVAAFELARAKREQEEEEARVREEEEALAAVKTKHLRLQEERRDQDRIALAEQQAARADKTRQARELALMRQEDFLSSQREQTERDSTFLALDALEQLRFIYTPYIALFADDDLEALLWAGPHKYKQRDRRRHVDPYCLPSDEYHMLDMCPDKSAYACLAGEREFHRLLGTPPLHLSSRSQPRNPTPSGNTRRVLQEQTVDVMLDMVRQVRSANGEVGRGLAGPCDERTHMEAQDVTGGGLRRSLAEQYRSEHEERQRDAWSRGSGRRPMSSQLQGPRPLSSQLQGLCPPAAPVPALMEEQTEQGCEGSKAGALGSDGPTPPLAVGSWQGPGGSRLSSLEGFESEGLGEASHGLFASTEPGDGSLTREGKELRSVALRVHVGPPVMRAPLTSGSVAASARTQAPPRTAASSAANGTGAHDNRFRMYSEVRLPPPFAGAGPMGVKGKPARLQGRKQK